jgi:hypothetical protein
LLQIHDFAEDNRPENCRRLISAIGAEDRATLDRYLYPVASQIRFCTLTQSDAEVLIELGVPSGQVNCLPNCVMSPAGSSHDGLDPTGNTESDSLLRVCRTFGLPADVRWCVYPVRGIRRKNVGELLLMSQLADVHQLFGLTLSPVTPAERRCYERWRQVGRDLGLRVVFDSGQHPDVSYIDNLLAADFVISTSVAEGFGMAFLEPWLLGREVIARRIRGVTDDFEANGLQLSKFYDSIPIPGDAAWVSRCRRQFAHAAERTWESIPEQFRPTSGIDLPCDDEIDFAQLVPAEQISVLKRMQNDSGFYREVASRSDSLVGHLRFRSERPLIDRNATVIRRQYSPEINGQRLMNLYRSALEAKVDRNVASPSRAGIGLDVIQQAKPFFPCRTEECIG